MKYTLYLFLIVNFLALTSFAQDGGVTIGANKSPHNSAILDLQATNKGFLPPRVTSLQRNGISSPAAGLIVFDTELNKLFLFTGKEWKPLATTDAIGLRTTSAATAASADEEAIPPYNTTNYDSSLGKLLVSDGNVWRDGNTGCLPSYSKKITCTRPGAAASSFDQSANLVLFPQNTARPLFEITSGTSIGLAVEPNDTNMICQSELLTDQAYYNNTTWNLMNVTATTSGTLAGRPRFALTKTDQSNWSAYRKLGLKLTTGSTYFFQVLVQRKSCTTFRLNFVSDGNKTEAFVTLDLLTGDITDGGAKPAGTIFNAKATPIKSTAGAWLFSCNFIPSTPATSNTTHQVRMIPYSTTVGDVLYVAAPFLTQTSNANSSYIASGKGLIPRGQERLIVDPNLQTTGTMLVKGLMNDRTTANSRAVSWRASSGLGLDPEGNGYTGGYAIAESGVLLENGGQFIPSAKGGTTVYYIDPSSSVAGNGSLGSPFNSLVQLPALSGNLNGTQILFKRGTLLREQLSLTGCSNFIVDAYGTGRLPILDGSDTVRLTWQQEGSVWFISSQSLGQTFFINTTRLIAVRTKDQMTNNINTSWLDANNKRLYINIGGAVNPNNEVIEITTRTYAVRLLNCSDYVVRNIQAQRARNSGIAITGGNKGIVEKCIAVYNGAFDNVSNLAGDGVVWYGTNSSTLSRGNIIRQCISNYNVNVSYEFAFQDSLLMEDNYGSRSGQGIELWGHVKNSLFQRNKIINVIPVGLSWGHGNAVWIPNSTIQPPITGGQNNNRFIANVFATTWQETLDIQVGKNEFYNNIFFDAARSREDFNGTFAWVGKINGTEPVEVIFRNNIFYQPTYMGYSVAAFKIDASVSAATLNHNFYYSDPSIGGYTPFNYMGTGYGGNFTNYKTGSKQDANSSSQVDPKFVKLAGKTATDVFQTFFNGSSRATLVLTDESLTDFHLSSTSPCIAAGDASVIGTVGADFVPFGTSRSVGAYSVLAGNPLSLGDRWLGGLNFRGGTLVDIQCSKGTLQDNTAVVQLSLCK